MQSRKVKLLLIHKISKPLPFNEMFLSLDVKSVIQKGECVPAYTYYLHAFIVVTHLPTIFFFDSQK